jgi:fatty acid desaturase
MKKNMGSVDRVVRILIAIVVTVLYFTGVISGVLGIALLVIAGVFVLTSLVNFCPLYRIFGIKTCAVK